MKKQTIKTTRTIRATGTVTTFAIVLFGFFGFVKSSQAATLYAGAGETYTTIPAGIAAMRAGDTLIIRDGTYSENIYTDQLPRGNSWNAGGYFTVKAENDGAAIISGTFRSLQEDPSPADGYYVWEGLKFISSSSKLDYRNHVKFLRCGFINGQVCGPCNACCSGAFIVGTGSNKLFEDCWFAGVGGRYKIAIYDSSNVVLRRCVIRNDGGYVWDGSNPEAPLVIYNSDNIAIQNLITIDNNLSYSEAYTTSIYATGHGTVYNPTPHSHPSNNVSIKGWIDINGIGGGFYADTDDGSTGMSISNSVIYGNRSGIAISNTGIPLTLSNLSIGNLSYRLFGIYSGSASVTNSIFWNFTNHSTPINNYCNTYNPSVWSGAGITHVDPLANGLLYLPRVEDETFLKTSGSSGGQMGAQIVKRIGVSGTMYGESGYDTLTNDDIWPWPNEDRIKTDFASVPTIGARGFAASGNDDWGKPLTLTRYIWQYLGNQIPCEIYDECGSDETAPASPSGLSVN